MNLVSKKLALGTVQFGLSYGVANTTGQVGQAESVAILEYAWANGLDTLDTAIVYGESEFRLGEIGVGSWQVISKLPAIPDGCPDVGSWVFESVRGSLLRLKINKLRGLLLHNSEQLLGPYGNLLYRALNALKNQGLVDKIGVSIYSPDELQAIWSRYPLDLVQAPFNIIDRRLATSGWLFRLHKEGVEIHVRSVFLQGLLLMRPVVMPAYFNRWWRLWHAWDNWLEKSNLSPLQACLSFSLSYPEIDRVVVGVDSLLQFKDILACLTKINILPPEELMCEDVDLVNPSRWR